MYISKIRIENIRCFDKVTLDLNSGSEIRKWILLLGDTY